MIALAALLTGSLSGCFWRKDERGRSPASSELYERAHKSMNTGNFRNAIQYYEGLEARFPFSNQSKQAQLDLIYCYYNDRQIEATVDAATTFERENPTHPRVDYALYMRGLAYFSGESSWYHRWFNVDLSKRPPKNLQESFSALFAARPALPEQRLLGGCPSAHDLPAQPAGRLRTARRALLHEPWRLAGGGQSRALSSSNTTTARRPSRSR